jgi:hypothetical protein
LIEQLESLEELARFLVAWIYSVVLDVRELLTSRPLVEGIDFRTLKFDVAAMRPDHLRFRDGVGTWAWSFDTQALYRFHQQPEAPLLPVALEAVP